MCNLLKDKRFPQALLYVANEESKIGARIGHTSLIKMQTATTPHRSLLLRSTEYTPHHNNHYTIRCMNNERIWQT